MASTTDRVDYRNMKLLDLLGDVNDEIISAECHRMNFNSYVQI